MPGRSEQKNIYSKTGSKKAMSPSQLEGLETFFNIPKEKCISISEKEDRIIWAVFLSLHF